MRVCVSGLIYFGGTQLAQVQTTLDSIPVLIILTGPDLMTMILMMMANIWPINNILMCDSV